MFVFVIYFALTRDLLMTHKDQHCKMNVCECFGSFIDLKWHLRRASHLSDAV